MKLRIGIDVGSTHTDAVIIDENSKLIAATKVPTTPDVTTGIINALEKVIEISKINVDDVIAVMFGTTHVLNAIIQRKGLCKVGILRIGKPATEAIEPMIDWPYDLKNAINPIYVIVQGGHEYSGEEIMPLNEDEIKKAANIFKEHNVEAIAITSVFSIVNPEHEIRAYEILSKYLPNIPIVMSHTIGSIGLVERENATILNAATIYVIRRAVNSLRKALEKLKLTHAKMYFAQNDGTTALAEFIEKYPIFTVVAPISNSIRGAYVLTGIENAIVIDMGGTTTNIGVLTKGYPREAGVEVYIGGVRTNIRAPDIIALGIAGGSIVKQLPNGEVIVGPESVGYKLVEEGIAWGGNTITATDIALALDKMIIEDPKCNPKLAKEKISKELAEKAYNYIVRSIEEAIDKIKTSPEPMKVILVGGGSAMLPKNLKGASEVYRPEAAQYANAVGAATALIGAFVEKAYSYEITSRDKAINEVIQEAKRKAIEAGAQESTIEVVDIEEIAMPYLPGNAVKIRVKVVGKLKL